MQTVVQTALDKISSARSSPETRGQALNTLEETLARLILQRGANHHDELQIFVQLQDTFQCNVPSRLLSWLSFQPSHLRKTLDGNSHAKADSKADLQTTVTTALNLVQGVALIHDPSKAFLGKEYAIDVFLDLLLVSRHVSSKPPADTHVQQDTPLASAVLDTLLCILVDSPPAIRVFEELNGVEVVVKVLKRAGIPRDIRMKCLEFLYFYLMDENTPSEDHSHLRRELSLSSSPPSCPTAPTSPTKPRASRSSQSINSSIKAPSFLTPSEHAPSLTKCLSLSPSPTLFDSIPSSPTKQSSQPQSLAMLRKDVDFVPLSPKKAQISQLGVGRIAPINLPNGAKNPTRFGRTESNDTIVSDEDYSRDSFDKSRSVRSTDEKREILGHLLGNVDTLVEGVKKAGIWGLG